MTNTTKRWIKRLFFINNSKYHSIAISKPNALSGKFYQSENQERSYLNCFGIFQENEKYKEHQMSSRNLDHVGLEIPKKF